MNILFYSKYLIFHFFMSCVTAYPNMGSNALSSLHTLTPNNPPRTNMSVSLPSFKFINLNGTLLSVYLKSVVPRPCSPIASFHELPFQQYSFCLNPSSWIQLLVVEISSHGDESCKQGNKPMSQPVMPGPPLPPPPLK